MTYEYDLSGIWAFRLDNDRYGIDRHYECSSFSDTIFLPGTTSEQQKGAQNEVCETGSLTVAYPAEGYAWYQRTLDIAPDAAAQHAILRLERTRISHVWVDGVYAGSRNSLCTSHVYDLTGYIRSQRPVLTLMTSNVGYPVRGGHMTSPDTQTNWNGILGSMTLTFYDTVRIRGLRTDVSYDKKELSGILDLDNYSDFDHATVTLRALPVTLQNLIIPENMPAARGDDLLLPAGEVVANPAARILFSLTFHLHAGENRLCFHTPLPDGLPVWDEYDPAVLRLAVSVTVGNGSGDSAAIWCGIRKFEARGMHFYINGRKTFLRGRHDGMIFPLTGYAPMNLAGWLSSMRTAKDFGINHYRCHTCCPPNAAFLAADLLGIYYEPELPFWGTFAASGEDGYDEAGQTYLTEEGFRILDEFGNHPSFCMMSMGNELWGSPQAVDALVRRYKAYDARHLYTQGSNNFQWVPNIQPGDDFFCGVRFTVDRQIRGSYAMCDKPLGHVQTDRPCTDFSYESAIFPHYSEETAKTPEGGMIEVQYGTGVKRVSLTEKSGGLIPSVPVVSHEIGQYETYPDFDEIAKYTGVLRARNFEIFRGRLEEKGLLSMAKDYFRNSGALAAACYKDELETALRTKDMAGFQILDIQDFSGQGTALVGMLDAFMENKGIISAKDFRSFCSDAVVQAQFPSYVIAAGSAFTGLISLTWYRQTLPADVTVRLSLTDLRNNTSVSEQALHYPAPLPENGYIELGTFSIGIPAAEEPEHYRLSVSIDSAGMNMTACPPDPASAEITNSYELWSYPAVPETADLHNILSRDAADAVRRSREGAPVVLCLSKDQNPHSITGTYCTDFWCYPMFRSISESMKKEVPVGTMGLLIRKEHPALAGFPTNSYSTPQWWDIVMDSASTILDDTTIVPIVQTIDNFERNHRLGLIYEIQLADAKTPILICTSPLDELAESGRCEAFWLLRSLCRYAASRSADSDPAYASQDSPGSMDGSTDHAGQGVYTMTEEEFTALFTDQTA